MGRTNSGFKSFLSFCSASTFGKPSILCSTNISIFLSTIFKQEFVSNLVSYPGTRAQGWNGSLESGTGQTSCESESQEDSHSRTESGSKRTGCGWCAADWTAS